MESAWRQAWAASRRAFNKGQAASQGQLDDLAATWVGRVNPFGKETETLALVDGQGQLLQPRRQAPRWLCHLLALRHKAVHVLLVWDSPKLGRVLVCQVRSWNKIDYPGYVDISVGGHVVGDGDSRQAAFLEMHEEIGVTSEDLVGGDLTFVGAYDCDHESDKRPFYDAEWRDVYIGTVRSLEAIYFTDGEVVGIYLCPQSEARGLLTQDRLAVANGLRLSLPVCLDYLAARG